MAMAICHDISAGGNCMDYPEETHGEEQDKYQAMTYWWKSSAQSIGTCIALGINLPHQLHFNVKILSCLPTGKPCAQG